MKNKDECYLFEFDLKFKTEKNFVFYDFNKPLEMEIDIKFDFILIDPPFITEEVWSKVIIINKYQYTQTIKYLSDGNTKILLCSIKENDTLLK